MYNFCDIHVIIAAPFEPEETKVRFLSSFNNFLIGFLLTDLNAVTHGSCVFCMLFLLLLVCLFIGLFLFIFYQKVQKRKACIHVITCTCMLSL